MTLEAALKKKLEKIFDMPITLDDPGDSNEQGKMFVSVENARHAIKEKRHVARVTGSISIFAQGADAPMGFFAKAIAKAYAKDTKDFYFFDLEEGSARTNDVVERRASFVFFFDGQYDPETGTIEELNLNVQVGE